MAYVSTIKSAAKKKARRPKRKPGRPRKSEASESLTDAHALLLKAVDLVLKAGGKEARQLVGMAAQMVERVGNGK